MKPDTSFVIVIHDVPENQKQTNDYLAELIPFVKDTFKLESDGLDTHLTNNQLRLRFTCTVPIVNEIEAIGIALTMNFRTTPTNVTIRTFTNLYEIGHTYKFEEQALQFIETLNTSNIKHMRNWLEHHAFRDYDVHCPFCNTPVELCEAYDFDVDDYIVHICLNVLDKFKNDDTVPLTNAEKQTYDTLQTQTFDPDTIWVCPNNECARIIDRKAHPIT